MNRTRFYLRYALRSLRRDGTRTVLAILCVMFGVLSLVSMQLLADTLLSSEMFDQRLSYTGDAQIQPEEYGTNFTRTDLEQIERWRDEGLITAYSPMAVAGGQLLRTEHSGRVTFLMNAFGIDPTTYPLAGELTLSAPANASPVDLLRTETDALLTRDLVDELNLKPGDTFLVGGGDTTAVRFTLVGIVSATPNLRGKTVYFSLDGARLLQNRRDVINTVSVLWQTPRDEIISTPYRVLVAIQGPGESGSANLFGLMLKGSGVLGLLVGGIGVSNTLQVILARRKLEIAMLKTVGWQRSHLLALISLETGIIGLIGGVIGGVLGSLIARELVQLLSRSGAMMVNWSPDLLIVGGGVLAGTMTGVIFGLQTILASSATRPIQLLRDLSLSTSFGVKAVRLVLYTALFTLFGLLIGIVTGSVVEGIVLVFGGAVLLIILRGVFWMLLWVALKLLKPPTPELKIALKSLSRRKAQSTLAVIALFAGTFAVTFATMVIYNAQERVMAERGSDEGFNLMAFTDRGEVSDAMGVMVTQGATVVYTRYRLKGSLQNSAGQDESIILDGRSEQDVTADLRIERGSLQGENAALVNVYRRDTDQYEIGDTITVSVDDMEKVLTITGFYIPLEKQNIAGSVGDIIVSDEMLSAFENVQVQVIAEFPVERLDAVADTIGATLPNALIFSMRDINDLMVSNYQTLFAFSISVAGLAFVAGAVLIANITGLALVERRREIGVFKSVGYTSRYVLRILLSEYGFLGFIAGICGLIAVWIAMMLINLSQPLAQLTFNPVIALCMWGVAIGIALLSAGVVAWQPTRVRPLAVLRYE